MAAHSTQTGPNLEQEKVSLDIRGPYGYWIIRWDELCFSRVLWGFPDGEHLTIVVLVTEYNSKKSYKNTTIPKTAAIAVTFKEGKLLSAQLHAANTIIEQEQTVKLFVNPNHQRESFGQIFHAANGDVPADCKAVLRLLVEQASQDSFSFPSPWRTFQVRPQGGLLLVTLNPEACSGTIGSQMQNILRRFTEVRGVIIASPKSPHFAAWLEYECERLIQANQRKRQQLDEAVRKQELHDSLNTLRRCLQPAVINSPPLADEGLCLILYPKERSGRQAIHPAEWSWGLAAGYRDGNGNIARIKSEKALEKFENTAWTEMLRGLLIIRDATKSYGWLHLKCQDTLEFRLVCEAGRCGKLYACASPDVLAGNDRADRDDFIQVGWRADRHEKWRWRRVEGGSGGTNGYFWEAEENKEAVHCPCFQSGDCALEMSKWNAPFWMRQVVHSSEAMCYGKVFVPDHAVKDATREILQVGSFWDPLPGVDVQYANDPPEAVLCYQEDGKVKAAWDYRGAEIPASTRAPAATRRIMESESGFVVINRQVEEEQKALASLAEKTGIPTTKLVRGTPVMKNASTAAAERQLRNWRREGIQIKGAPNLDQDIVQIALDEVPLELNEQQGWFTFSSHIDVRGQRVDLVPILSKLVQQEGGFDALADRDDDYPLEWMLEDGKLASINLGRLREMLRWIEQFFGIKAPRQLSHAEALGAMLASEAQSALSKRWRGPDVLASQVDRLRQGSQVQLPDHPIIARLRPYQQESLHWALNLFKVKMGGLLADEMGLGKTIQSIAIMLAVGKKATQPHLVLCPLSVAWNWASELQRFAPELKVSVIGRTSSTIRDWDEAAQADVIVCPFSMALADQKKLLSMSFSVCVMDEAHILRNPKTRTYKVVAALQAQHRLALTGTPLQNHPLDLWAIFSLLVPGLLGDLDAFQKAFGRDQVSGYARRMRTLAAIVAPFTKRRRKQDVDLQLPPLEVVTRLVSFSEDQADLYESMRAATFIKADTLIQSKGIKNSHIELLAAITRLRQLCCDPKLVDSERFKEISSAKVEALMDMLEELREEGRRPLIFSSFVSLLQIVAAQMDSRGFKVLQLTGQTLNRQDVVERFEAGEGDAFLISLKAGGMGLNLVSADTVILLDPWWNPAMEAQAIGRAHRHGQSKNVTVFRLITRGTIEERIQALQARKEQLADIALGEDQEGQGLVPEAFNEELIHTLLAPEVGVGALSQ